MPLLRPGADLSAAAKLDQVVQEGAFHARGARNAFSAQKDAQSYVLLTRLDRIAGGRSWAAQVPCAGIRTGPERSETGLRHVGVLYALDVAAKRARPVVRRIAAAGVFAAGRTA